MLFRYSDWDGSQSIDPLSSDELLDLVAEDLLEDGDLRRALERLLLRGARRPNDPNNRIQGMRDLMDRLRERRDQQLNRYDLSSVFDDIGERLQDILDSEQEGIERLRNDAAGQEDADMRRMAEQLAQRKQDAIDNMPDDLAGRMQRLMDYEFIDPEARQAFQDLVNELRQKMLGEQFQMMQQGMQSLSAEDMGPIKEMIRALNQLLAKHLRGGATEQDFREFMAEFGHMFPPGIESIEDLVRHLEQQAAQMTSLLQSMPEEMRQQMLEMMQALLNDEELQDNLRQMADMIEQITGRPLGRPYPFSGEEQVDLSGAMDVLQDLNSVDELERQLRQAMRDFNFDNVDADLMRDVLDPEAAAALEEMRRISRLLEDSGLAKREGNDMDLSVRGIRRLGERTLKDLFAELRRDRAGQHDLRARGASSEQTPETKPWEFGDPFLVDIGTSISNAVRRAGPGLPVKISDKDIEVHRTEALVNSATVIAMDMSRSMFTNGAFREAKRVALALNTLIKTRYPRDYLELVVFSYFAMQLKPERLLQSDWVDWSGTNIQLALEKAREMLSHHKSSNRQIILITDWRPRPTWGPYGDEGTIESLLKEVKRCTQGGIRINTFMMDRDPTSMALAQAMMRINKGRVFFGTPGQVGRYVLVDFLKNKRRQL